MLISATCFEDCEAALTVLPDGLALTELASHRNAVGGDAPAGLQARS